MGFGNVYRIDHTYEDRRDLAEPNQFVRWLEIKNSGGMRPMLRNTGSGAARLAALILVSRHISGSGYNPWQDVIDRKQGRIFYWGDAKADPRKGRDEFEGNRFLASIWQAINEHRWEDVPPILHFSKEKPGTVRFNGLCVLADLQDAWFEDAGRRVRNYHAELHVLPVESVPVAWLKMRRTAPMPLHVADQPVLDPDAWKIYARTGVHKRLVLWRNQIRSQEEQLPPAGSPEWRALEQLHGLDPLRAERLVVRAFESIPIAHSIEQTAFTGDGGFDFFGSFQLPPPLSYSIPLKGEVKRYQPGEGKVGPREVARLVARLQRGEHGVFVTTSAFTRQCQEEVLADAYPVELISGAQLVGMLQHLGAVRSDGLDPEWMHMISA